MRIFGPLTGQKSAFFIKLLLYEGGAVKDWIFLAALSEKYPRISMRRGCSKRTFLNNPNICLCLASLALAQEGGDIQVLGVDAAGLEIVLNRLGLRLGQGLRLANLVFGSNRNPLDRLGAKEAHWLFRRLTSRVFDHHRAGYTGAIKAGGNH